MIQKSALTGLTKPLALFRFNEARQRPGAVVEMIEQDDGLWTVTMVWDDNEEVNFQDLEAFDETAVTAPKDAVEAAAPAGESKLLGQLSRKFESNSRPGAIGFDTKGGFSYGTYQIATRTGTMDRFLSFLGDKFPAFSQKLGESGGANAALAGSQAFKDAWITLAADPSFASAQHRFIAATHYEPFAQRLLDDLGLDVDSRTPVMRDVAWSVAVQHGSGNSVFRDALVNKNASALKDAEIIPLVYAERSDVEKRFPSSSPQVKRALVARFQQELKDAMSRLA
jgi:hypothetical protein